MCARIAQGVRIILPATYYTLFLLEMFFSSPGYKRCLEILKLLEIGSVSAEIRGNVFHVFLSGTSVQIFQHLRALRKCCLQIKKAYIQAERGRIMMTKTTWLFKVHNCNIFRQLLIGASNSGTRGC